MRIIISLLLTIIFSYSVMAAKPTEERPKIGLVLSGGGAKGLAHVGVLKVLEEAGIRPDYITGTSMGGIIGGLYAIGYSATELDSIVRALNWSQLLSDRVPLSIVLPEEKHDYQRFHVELDITKDGLRTPAGFISGHSISEMISRLSWHKSGIESFDEFPIPFKCVATDLISGEQIVFDKGDFTTALRATMAIPSVFAPVVNDSMILIDGGVLNNFPVKLCKEMGADIIIGVNVGTPDKTSPADLLSPTNILSSAAMIGNNISMRLQMPYVDILITPELEPFTAASFFDGDMIIDRGEAAARTVLFELESLSDKINSFEQPETPSRQKIPERIKISEIRINGLERISYHFFISNLGIEPGDTIAPRDMEKKIHKLIGTRYFESVSYRIYPINDDGFVLDLQAIESETARFKFSLHYDNEYKAGIITNVTLRNILMRGNRLSTTFDISEKPRLNTSIINYLGESHRLASRVEFDLESNNLPIYHDNNAVYGTFNHYYTSLALGLMSTVGTRWEHNAFMRYERSVMSQNSGFFELFSEGVKRFGNSFVSACFTSTRNTLNRRHFPDKGSLFHFTFKHYLDIDEVYRGRNDSRFLIGESTSHGEKNTSFLSVGFQGYQKLSSRLVINPGFQVGYSNKDLPLPGLNFVGGMPFHNRSNEISFAGLNPREKIVQDFAMAKIDIRYRFQRKLHGTLMVNGIVSQSTNHSELENIIIGEDETIIGYGLLVEYDSIIGPIRLGGAGNSDGGGVRWYFGLGYHF
ncbi:patatin-like phospholipase family protein [Natronoflexus pectinivorans]|uniref:NTE family protein n=1 Tax=Natronoflexus pectinivorans TaxID=682526 RepID=A0A4R2GNC7_9BACT|nr:patatin-like phospholipase family protein [Natronoflexus pectinivorans]TCO10763.1 NTE family protein [Natronoflexus pectinivorans]